MNLRYEIIYRKGLTNVHRTIFADFLKLQGKVRGNLLIKADRCKFVCIVTHIDLPIAIGGIKPKTTEDFDHENADLGDLESSFDWEIGYIYTDPNYTRKGIASNLVQTLLNEFGDGNLMASTEIKDNPGMVRILEKNGFKNYGKLWKSGIHSNNLGLFLRFK